MTVSAGRARRVRMGLVGFEPTTKGFTCPGVSAGSGLSLHPRRRRRGAANRDPQSAPSSVWVRDAHACHQGRWSPQVVSAPSGGVPPARLRIAMSSTRGRSSKVPLNSSRPLRAFPRAGTIDDESPALTAVLQAQPASFYLLLISSASDVARAACAKLAPTPARTELL